MQRPRKANQSTQLLFSSEWEKKIEFDLPGGAAAPLRRLMLAGQLDKAKAGRTEPAVGFGFVVVFACAVRGPEGCSAKEEDKPNQTKPTRSE